MNKAVVEKSKIIKYKHGFSTRIGGVSEGIYESLNLGMNRGDEVEKVKENWKLFFEKCGINSKNFVCGNQIHGNNVHVAKKADARPAYGPGVLIDADGYVTKEKNLPLAIFTADCVPVLLEDREAEIIGAVHSGWRSTVLDIEKEAIDKMINLGSSPENIHIAIGPAIDKCCFEVGSEVIDGIEELINDASDFYYKKENGKYMLDLRGVVRKRFHELNIPYENIELVGECTMCHPEKYYSHRYTSGKRGSLACSISMEEE